MMEEVFRRASQFNFLHFHTDYLHYPLSRRAGVPFVTTLHGRLDLPDLVPLYRTFPRTPVVSISDAQREPLPWLRWEGTVHHGMPQDLLPCGEGGEDLVFLGRISPEKRPDRAIEIATRAGRRLWIAAKVDRADRDYFEQRIRPLTKRPGIEFVGEIGERDKASLLGTAHALLFPVDWPEPFGLVMIESMACGTPVIAWPHGSVPEVIEPGLTGYLVHDVGSAVDAVQRAGALSRTGIRERFETRFTAQRMARDYLRIYRRLSGRGAAEDTMPHEAGAPS
jgi:glycosyltransferase involved in cell wall biosynthesis